MGKRRFWASLSAAESQTIATRGSNISLEGHVRGWNSGVKVIAHPEEDEDRFDLYLTTGSHATASDRFLGSVLLAEDETGNVRPTFYRYGDKMPD